MTGTPDRTYAEHLRGNLDFDADVLKIALFDDSTAYTFDSVNHEFVADILDGGTTAQELSGSAGYTGTSDRKTLSGVAVSEDNTDNEGVLDANDITWNGVSSTEDIQGWIIYKQVGGDDTTPGDDPVLLVVDDGMSDAPTNLPLTTDGSNVSIAWAVEGIINQVTA